MGIWRVGALLLLTLGSSTCKRKPKPADFTPHPRNQLVVEPLPAAIQALEPMATSLPAFAGTAADDVWLSCGVLLHFDGVTWSVPPGGERLGGFNAMSAVSRDEVWAAANGGKVYRWDGKTWTTLRIPNFDAGLETWDDLHSIVAWSETDVWVPSRHGWIYRWDGAQWTKLAVPPPWPKTRLLSIWGTGPENVYLIASTLPPGGLSRSELDRTRGDLYRLLHWDGSSWKAEPLAVKGTLDAIHGSGASDVWVVGLNTATEPYQADSYHFDGTAWTQHALPPGAGFIRAVYATKPGEAWGLGDDAVWSVATSSLLYRWEGQRWAVLPTGAGKGLSALFAPPGARPLVAGPRLLLRGK